MKRRASAEPLVPVPPPGRSAPSPAVAPAAGEGHPGGMMVPAHRLGLWGRREVVDRILFHGRPIVCALAFVWRRLLFRTVFVAITGSVGKTTAKECAAACLAARFRTACGRGDTNVDGWLTLDVLRVRPWHRYAVLEVAAGMPGQIARRA